MHTHTHTHTHCKELLVHFPSSAATRLSNAFCFLLEYVIGLIENRRDDFPRPKTGDAECIFCVPHPMSNHTGVTRPTFFKPLKYVERTFIPQTNDSGGIYFITPGPRIPSNVTYGRIKLVFLTYTHVPLTCCYVYT